MADVPYNMTQAGAVAMFSGSDLASGPVSVIYGDRRFSLFGDQILVSRFLFHLY